MPGKHPEDYLNLSMIMLLIGVVIVIAGIYFSANELTTSGLTMGETGEQYGTGTIDGKGMVFCGIIVCGFGLALRNEKQEDT